MLHRGIVDPEDSDTKTLQGVVTILNKGMFNPFDESTARRERQLTGTHFWRSNDSK
jgi:hypothetical protein